MELTVVRWAGHGVNSGVVGGAWRYQQCCGGRGMELTVVWWAGHGVNSGVVGGAWS